MADEQLEFGFLKRAVEIIFDRRLSTTSDFTALSEEMEERISPSTLKRLWGYVGMVVTPRRSTLDALSQFVGYKDYRAFCSSLRESSFSSCSLPFEREESCAKGLNISSSLFSSFSRIVIQR